MKMEPALERHDATLHAGNAPAATPAASRMRSRLTLLALCMAVIVAQVDTSVVNLATRPIGEAFHASVGALQWVIDAYNLLYAGLLLSGGLLADLHGRRRVFNAGAAVFVVASLACALASSIGMLVAGRALAGVGAALLLPASLAIVRVAWPDPAARARALGIWAACNGVALAIGPTLGGVLIEAFGWRSVFAMVIPLGVLAIVLARVSIAESSDPQQRHFDGFAQLLGGATLGALALAAIEVQRAPGPAAGALALALASLAAFVAVERRRGTQALVPLEIFRARRFRAAMIATAAMTFGMYGTLFLVPLTWQASGLLDALHAGIALVPTALAFVLVSPLSGPISNRIGTRLLTCGGVLVIACGLLAIGLASGSSSVAPFEIGLTLTGIGMGFATGPLMAEAVGAVPPRRAGTASALINVARIGGATLGVAVLGTAYALAGDATVGLRWAMMAGAGAQLVLVLLAWRDTRRSAR